MPDMDAAHASSNLSREGRADGASVPLRLPVWVPPVCALMLGAGMALQTPHDGNPRLEFSLALVGLALGVAAYALLACVRARRGIRRRRPSAALLAVYVVCAANFPGSRISHLPWFYIACGTVTTAVVWYRLQTMPVLNAKD